MAFFLRIYCVSVFFLFAVSVSPFHHHRHGSESGHDQAAHGPRNVARHPEGSSRGHQGQDVHQGNAASCGCGAASAGGGQWMNGVPAHGVQLFLFPDYVVKAVDVVLRGENALHRDNDDLARHLFHFLAHQFPRKWFIVGVGTMPARGVRAPLRFPPGYGGFSSFEGRRFQRENGSRIWFFVHAMEPGTAKITEKPERKSLAKCLPKKGCSSDNLASICANSPRQLGMVVQFSQKSQVSIFASEPLTLDSASMALVKKSKKCLEENKEEVVATGAEERGQMQQHILLVAAPEGAKERAWRSSARTAEEFFLCPTMIGITTMLLALLLFLFSLINRANSNIHFHQFDMGQERSLRFPRQQSPNSNVASPQMTASDSAKAAPLFQPMSNDLPAQLKLSDKDKETVDKATSFTNSLLERLGLSGQGEQQQQQKDIRRQPPIASYQTDELAALGADLAANRVDLHGLASGQIPGLAPIPVPGFAGPQDAPTVPGVNTIPGLSNFNYIIGQLVPQMIPPTNTLLGSSISRLLPKDATKNLAKNVFRAVHPAAENVDVARMMGRWFQVINSPHVIREACTVSHFGALTNNTYSATFTILKFYREGNSNGPPRFSLGYGFKAGDTGQFLLHSSNSPDAEPFWVIKLGPLNEYNQYDYAVVSNWVRYPVFVIARDPERFHRQHMKKVLQFLEDNNYINVMTKAFNLISPVDYSQCQYTPTFSGAGR
uniref:Lipocalin domain-containing protein n=2 Tax=Globodera TaxID=31242 RepID=A0A914HDH5_GLORO